jgi:RNA polymerase sigma-70 factor (ECF subfamily)
MPRVRSSSTRRSEGSASAEGRVVALAPARLDEREMVAGLARRDAAAVTALYDRCASLDTRLLERVLGDSIDSDDLVQDTFVIVVRRAREIRDPDALKSFVVGVALRRARNELRKRALRRFVGIDTPATIPITQAQDPAVTECVEHVYRALDRLDASSRLAFVLRHVEGFELTEVASALGVSLATAKRRISRAESRFEAIAAGDPVLRERLARSPSSGRRQS